MPSSAVGQLLAFSLEYRLDGETLSTAHRSPLTPWLCVLGFKALSFLIRKLGIKMLLCRNVVSGNMSKKKRKMDGRRGRSPLFSLPLLLLFAVFSLFRMHSPFSESKRPHSSLRPSQSSCLQLSLKLHLLTLKEHAFLSHSLE